ncbi:N-acyl homoserine lactonase family protein [soil metagenome]
MRATAFLLLAAVLTLTSPHSNAADAEAPQLYTLDCGRLDVADMGEFSDTGEHSGEIGSLAAPCFLIHHGRDWLLWDTGLGDDIAAHPNGVERFGYHFTVRSTLRAQLAMLGLKPADIGFVALSHLHADHSGNIGLFPKATFLMSAKELAWARRKPAPGGIAPALIAPLARARVKATDQDMDVFGDGSVQILNGPGHTPGHRFLLLKLANAGAVLLSGDLFHTRENYQKGLMPPDNWSRAETLASFNRFAGIQRFTNARVIVQHAEEDIAALPPFPSFLD